MYSIRKLAIVLCTTIIFSATVNCDELAHAETLAAADAGAIPGLPADFRLNPGVAAQLLPLLGLGGAGISKNLDFSAGAGAGLGVPPPPPIGGNAFLMDF